MMKLYKYPDQQTVNTIIQRPYSDNSAVEEKVKKIIEKIKQKGDKALYKYTEKFDGVALKEIKVSNKEIKASETLISDQLKNAIQQAKKNIEVFHAAQKEEVKKTETMPGVVCWRRSVAIEKVGLYIPGGTAPLFSTILMLAVPAQLAGCNEIILCTPSSKNGSIDPVILYTAQLCGIKNIFKVGGAQAIAAMAFGTETIPKVFKIFGPGNQYVTTAKQLIQQEGVAIDMPAGPSELLIIADETAEPEYVAADLLSQAEHGIDSQVILITTDEMIAEKVLNEIKKQTGSLPRKKIVDRSLKNGAMIVVKNIEDAFKISNQYAPEHLILAVKNAEESAEKIISAGSVFIGNYSPESAGDYASGTNHVLPTNGYAAMYSGVSLESFCKKITYQRITKEGLNNIGEAVATMAAAEGLDAHKNAVLIRLKK